MCFRTHLFIIEYLVPIFSWEKIPEYQNVNLTFKCLSELQTHEMRRHVYKYLVIQLNVSCDGFVFYGFRVSVFLSVT